MRVNWVLAVVVWSVWAGHGVAQDLARCETSIRGVTESFAYDASSPALKDSQSLRERVYGARGAITCPGLVTLRAMTPEMDDSQRGPFCLQWDDAARSYIGYDIGARDAWLTCRTPSASFCERVNRSKAAATRMTGAAADFAFQTGARLVQHPSGLAMVQGSGAAVGQQLSGLGASAAGTLSAPAVLGALAVTAVAVGGAVYVCSDAGAGGAALQAAPVDEGAVE